MAIADRFGLPVAVHIESASPHETKLVDATLQACPIVEDIERLLGDRAYDSDPLDKQLEQRGIEMIAHHRTNRRPDTKTQDGRQARRLKHRWVVERLFAWMQNFRRLVVRYERHAENFLGFCQLACTLILLRRF
jgi:transposase